LRPQSLRSSRRRAARLVAAGAAIGIGHLGLLLILSVTAPKVAPGPKVGPAHVDFTVRLEPPKPVKPAKPAPPPRRVRRPEPPPRAESARPAPGRPPQAGVAATPAAPQTLPSPPNYDRWTVAPGAASAPAQAQAPAPGLPGCTPATLPALTGAARDACAKRLVETARNAPVLPPAGYQRNVEAQAYAQAVKAWKKSSAMTPHPCPPQDEPAHKLYFDKCSLVNAARSVGGPLGSPGVKIEFKYKF
jgi:hypothetical protein